MALILADRVQETSTTTGNGTFTLDGAVTQYQTFSSAIGNGNTTYYAIVLDNGSEWEVGLGTVGAGTLARTTVLSSSAAGAKVVFSAGSKHVWGDYPAAKALFLDASGNAIALGTPASATLTNATGLPISTGVSGLGANVATFLGTPSSANLASAITDETGSGVLVFGTSPSFTTSVVSASSSLDVFNTTATTVNAFGAATALTIGASNSGTATLRNSTVAITYAATVGTTLGVTGVATFSNATDSTSSATGAVVVTGGVGIGNHLTVGTQLYVGTNSVTETGFANATIVARNSGTTYTQVALINSNNNGSSDFAAYGDNGSDVAGWADFGMTGSAFNDGNYTITGKNDGYFFVQAVSGTGLLGNMVLATGSNGTTNDIIFATGGFLTANEKMRFIHSSGQLHIKTDTDASNTSTGVLRVAGGVGIAKKLYVGSDLNVTGNAVVTGNLTVNGTTTTLNTETIEVEDINIVLGKVTVPSDTTADGGGITLLGDVNKTFNWVNATDAWTSSEHINLASGKAFYIAGTSVLNGTTLGTGVITSSLTTVGTIGTGTWQGSVVAGQYGGTGVANTGKTITLGGNLTTSGAFDTTLNVTALTSVTLPTTGTLATLAGSESLTNKKLGSLTSNGLVTTSGGDGTLSVTTLGTGVATFLSTPSSSNLISAITDETGSGALVFGTGPTITLPIVNNTKQGYSTTATAAGTTILTVNSNRVQFFTGTTTQVLSLPAPQTMTLGMEFLIVNNSTGSVEVRAANSATVAIVLPGTAVSCISIDTTAGNGAAGWNAEFVGFSSVTGTGANVLATSPTLTTPVLGAATATSINGLTITSSTGTLTVANGKTLTASNTLTFTGTDASSVAFGTGGTVAYTSNKLNAFAATTSAELLGVISDETGTGSLVFANTPTLVTPNIGAATGTSLVATGDVKAKELWSTNSTGDEGGQINLAQPATNSTLAGDTVTIDIWQNRIRIFEQGGDARGVYIDLTSAATGVGTNLLASSGSGTVTSITAGTGLTGGTITVSGTIAIDTNVVVDKTTIQTLSNKTLTLPTIQGTGAAFSGSSSGTITLLATATAGTNTITLPATTGTVITTGDSATVTNTMLAGSIANNKLTNSSITVGSTSISLGGTSTSLAGMSFITFSGATSGTSQLIPAAIAGSGSVLTLPTGTDTLVGKATSDVFTNKTISLTTNTLTFTSLELKTACSDETGSGSLVFATSPTLVTPTLGVAAATSINKVAITAPATSATLTIADGKTLTVSNTLTFTGTDSSSVAFGAGGTVAYTGGTLAQFAATTSSQLAGVISDETGSGALVFGTAPTIAGGTHTGITSLGIRDTSAAFDVTLAAVSSVALTGARTLTLDVTNASRVIKLAGNLDIAGNLTTAGAFGVTLTATALTSVTLPTSGTLYGTATGSITSAELLASLTDETGTGVAVFGTAPTFTTSIDSGATFAAFASSTALTLGYSSTLASTTNISTGATASGQTKTLNIGTGGAAGSTTNVNIGSSVAGTTTINGIATITGAATLSSTLAVNGASLTSTQTTFNLLNTTVDSLNFAGAATAINIGSAIGTTTILNPLTNVNSLESVTGGAGVEALNVTLNPTGGTLGIQMYGKYSGAHLRMTWPGVADWDHKLDLSGNYTLVGGTGAFILTGSPMQLNGAQELRFADSDSTNYVGFKSPATVTTNKIWTLPAADGTTGQVLSTDGAGVLSWATASGGSTNSFANIAVSGQTTVAADSSTDTLTLVAGTNITITTDASTDTITITAGSLSITDDTTTNANTFYPAMATATSGSASGITVSSTKMYFNPSTGTLNTTIYNSLSDVKFKENISTITNALDVIDKINPVEFTWKDNGNKSFGVIAQEIEKVLPEIVGTDDDVKSVSYTQLIPFLIQAIKEQQVMIDELKKKIESK